MAHYFDRDHSCPGHSFCDLQNDTEKESQQNYK